MGDDLKRDLKKYFPRGVISSLDNVLKGTNFRVQLVKRDYARDLNWICSECHYTRKDSNGNVVYSVEDIALDIVSGDLIPGSIEQHSVLKDSSSPNGDVVFKEIVRPTVGSNNVLLVKKSRRSDKSRGYSNFECTNVYIIV